LTNIAVLAAAGGDAHTDIPLLFNTNQSFYGIAALSLSVASNTFATSLIGYKAWYVCVSLNLSSDNDLPLNTIRVRRHHKRIGPQLWIGSRRTMAERVMTLLVESGGLYVCVWVRAVYKFIYPFHILTCGVRHRFFISLPIQTPIVLDQRSTATVYLVI
jgi:hypothetical protein